MAALSPTETAVAYSVRNRPGARRPSPASVLLVVDRSRSVGLPGLSAERDLARRLLEALPPTRALRRPVLRSRHEAAVPHEPARHAGGDRRAGGGDGPERARRTAPIWRRRCARRARCCAARQITFAPRRCCRWSPTARSGRPGRRGARSRARRRCRGSISTSAAFVVRPPEDDPAARGAAGSCDFAARGAESRASCASSDIGEAVTAAMADIDRGGDLACAADWSVPEAVTSLRRAGAGRGRDGGAGGTGAVPRAQHRGHSRRQPGRVAGFHSARIAADWVRAFGAARFGPLPEATARSDRRGLVALVEPVDPDSPGKPSPSFAGRWTGW